MKIVDWNLVEGDFQLLIALDLFSRLTEGFGILLWAIVDVFEVVARYQKNFRLLMASVLSHHQFGIVVILFRFLKWMFL